MDPINATASLVTLAVLVKSIFQLCSRYVKEVKYAPKIFVHFCDELEALNILFQHLLDTQNRRERSGSLQNHILKQVLRRTDLLRTYESELRSLRDDLSEHNRLGRLSQRIIFPFKERRFSDSLITIRNISVILEAALRQDDSLYFRSIGSRLDKFNENTNIHYKSIQRTILIENERLKAELNGLRKTLEIASCNDSGAKQSYFGCDKRRLLRYRFQDYSLAENIRPSIFTFTLGAFHIRYYISSTEEDGTHRRATEAPRSCLSIYFYPTHWFLQTIVRLHLEWQVNQDVFLPSMDLRFTDIIPDDHEIIKASSIGDITTIKILLKKREVSPYCSTVTGWTPLHFAAAYGRVDTCKVLLENGALNSKDGLYGITPLHVAAHFGRVEAFKILLAAGWDPEDYHAHAQNAIFEILTNNEVSGTSMARDLVKWLLYGQDNFMIDVRATDNAGRSMLYYALWASNTIIRVPKTQYEQAEYMLTVLRRGFQVDEPDIYGMSILHHACRHGSLQLVQKMIASGTNINARNRDGLSPLHCAILSGDSRLVQILIDAGADVNASFQDMCHLYQTSCPLQITKVYGLLGSLECILRLKYRSEFISHMVGIWTASHNPRSLEVVRRFLDTVQKYELDLCGLLSFAEIDPRLIQIFMEASASTKESCIHVPHTPHTPYTQTNRPVTPFVQSGPGFSNHKPSLSNWLPRNEIQRDKWLLRLQAFFNKPGGFKVTPLYIAAEKGYGDIIRLLLSSGAVINRELSKDIVWPIEAREAAYTFDRLSRNVCSSARLNGLLQKDSDGNHVSMEVLCNNGPVCALIYSDGAESNRLSIAIANNDLHSFRRLIGEISSLNGDNLVTMSPLTLSILWRRWEMAKILINRGANLNILAFEGNASSDMPFHDAVRAGNPEIVKLMLEKGAQIDLRNEDGEIPLISSLSSHPSRLGRQCLELLASKSTHIDTSPIVSLLVSAGSDVNATCDRGQTPLSLAAAYGEVEAVTILIEAGANINTPSSIRVYDCPTALAASTAMYPPIVWASRYHREKIVKVLFDAGAEWESVRKDPTLWYINHFHMQSWFPERKDLLEVGSKPSNYNATSKDVHRKSISTSSGWETNAYPTSTLVANKTTPLITPDQGSYKWPKFRSRRDLSGPCLWIWRIVKLYLLEAGLTLSVAMLLLFRQVIRLQLSWSLASVRRTATQATIGFLMAIALEWWPR